MMNMDTKKSSRVHQLRDLFQMGTPRPAEELDAVEFSRPRANTSPATIDGDNLTSETCNRSTVEHKSDVLQHNLLPLESTADTCDHGSKEDPHSAWVVRKHRTISDPDIDLSKTYKVDEEIDSNTAKSPESSPFRKHTHEFNVSILCPIVPFSGHHNTKIRPLGEEFKARRISKNLQDDSPGKDNKFHGSDGSERPGERKSPSPSLVPSPGYVPPPTLNSDSLAVDATNQKQGTDPILPLVENNHPLNHSSDRGVFPETTPDVSDADSDVDNQHCGDSPSLNLAELSMDNFDDLMDSYTSELTRISAEIEQVESGSPEIVHRAIIMQPTVMTPQELIHIESNRQEFQDYLLESDNFQTEKPMNAESIDIDDKVTTSDEDNNEEVEEDDEDCYVIASRMDYADEHEITPTNDVISYEMICPKPLDIVSVEDGCNILEDGHFFYEKDMDVDTECEMEFEYHNITKSNKEAIKTYKRPGARVHFHLDKVTVFSTHMAEEYDRKNEDVDPLSASAEYEMEKRLENMNIFPVDLYKGSKGLGISILGMGVGHCSGVQKLGIFVKSIIPGGAAEEDGRIQVYDQIVEVNGESLVSVSQEIAASVLKNTHGVVHFLIGREIDQTNSEIVRLVEKSRQNSGMVSKPEAATPAPLAEMEDEIIKAAMDAKHEDKEPLYIPDNTTFSLNPESQTEDEESRESEPFGTATSILDVECVGTSTVSIQTSVTWEQIRSKEDLLNDEITDLKNQLDESRAKEENLFKTIFELKDKIEDNHIIKSELELLQRNYDEIQVDYEKTQSDLHEAQLVIEELSEENGLIKDKLEETTKKYKKVKRIFKMAELRNESQQNYDYRQSEILTFYEEKVKHLEKQIEDLELKLTPSDSKGETAVPFRKYEPTLLSSPSDEFINVNNENGKNKKEIIQPKSSSVSSSDMDEEQLMVGKSVEITSRIPQRRDSDKVLADLNMNMSNNTGLNDEIFDELTNTNAMLDNRVAKNKAELRKSGLMANRKPPSKAIMIGSKDAAESNKSSLDDDPDTVEDNYGSNTADRSPTKGTGSKIVGGFALPGKNEIKLAADDTNVKSKHKSRIFGIKPSNIVGSKKTGKITQNSSDDMATSDRVSNSAKSWDPSSKSGSTHKESVILLSAKSLDNDALFDKPNMNFYCSDLLPKDCAKGESYTFHDSELPTEHTKLYNIPPADWDKEQVIEWCRSIGLGHVENVLLNGGIVSGYKLIRLDSDLIKKIGVTNSNDRMILKRKIKELRQFVPAASTKPQPPPSVDASKNGAANHKSKL